MLKIGIMNENLNLMEILKDCPKGTKFYSTIYGEVNFKGINKVSNYPIEYTLPNGCTVNVTSDGLQCFNYDGECTLFPSKYQRDWSKWHLPFKDGDIIFTRTKLCQNYGFDWISIFKEFQSDICVNYLNLCLNDYALYYHEGDAVLFDKGVILSLNSSDIIEQRLANENEKQQLFDTIKKSGYKWDAENRKLDILPTPVNDIYKCNIDVKDLDIVPKFKVGDNIIESKSGKRAFVVYIGMDRYNICTTEFDFMGVLFKDQDDWELYEKPNVFDPSTLIPFESKVLVRDGNHFSWVGSIYTHHKENGFYTVNGRYYYQCIPYNDDTAHLIGTYKDAPKYYKYWED